MLRRRMRLRRFAAGAFSLPELMIALAILGLGLLIIAAALPAGLQYTSDTSAQVTGDAVSKYATDELGQRLRTSSKLGDSKATLRTGNPSDPDYWVPMPGRRRDPLVRPRISIAVSGSSLIDDSDAHLQARLALAPVDPDAPMPPNAARPFDLATIPSAIGGTDANVFADWEPIIKLRAFVGLNLDPTAAYNPSTAQPYAQYNQVVENSEEQIRGWLLDMESITFATSGISYLRRDVHKLLTDVDVWPVDRTGSQDRWGGTGVGRFSLRTNPALSPTMRAFPPAENATRYQVAKYFQDLQNANLRQQRLPWLPATDSLIGPDYSFIDPTEIRRLLDTRYAWTGFYRRVSYAPGSDSSLYEIIVVVTRRPSAAHYYLAADTTNTNLAMPPINTLNLAAGGQPRSRLFPEPWLVTFVPGPQGYFYEPHLTPQHFPSENGNTIITPDRNLRPDLTPPDRLTFYATPNVARLLPKGSYFFPATNDETSRGSSSSQIAEFTGFVPRAATDQPMYQVIDQIPNAFNDTVGIVVSFNGFYPWVKSSDPNNPLAADANQPRCWPVWVIPPAVAGGALERKSSIVTILRETVRIPEIKN